VKQKTGNENSLRYVRKTNVIRVGQNPLKKCLNIRVLTTYSNYIFTCWNCRGCEFLFCDECRYKGFCQFCSTGEYAFVSKYEKKERRVLIERESDATDRRLRAFWGYVSFLVILPLVLWFIGTIVNELSKQQAIQTSSVASGVLQQRSTETTREANNIDQRKRDRLIRLRKIYFNSIRQHVGKHWIAVGNQRPKVDCVVAVIQGIDGDIHKIVDISGEIGDAAAREMLEKAILRASPLPTAPDPQLFDTRIKFFFKQ